MIESSISSTLIKTTVTQGSEISTVVENDTVVMTSLADMGPQGPKGDAGDSGLDQETDLDLVFVYNLSK